MQKTRNDRRMDVEQSGRCGCGCGFLTRADQADDFSLLVGLKFGWLPPMRPCLRASSRPLRSIARSDSEKLVMICIIMRARRGGVNRLGQAAKARLRVGITLKHS